MPTKHKPRRGWKSSDSLKPFPFTETDLKKIADVLRIETPWPACPLLSQEIRQQLVEATHKYLISKKIIDDAPRPSEVKAALEEVHKRAKALTDCLQQLDSISRDKLMLAGIIPYDSDRATEDDGLAKGSQRELDEAIKTGRAVSKPGIMPTEILDAIDRCQSDAALINKVAKRALHQLEPDTGGPPPSRRALRSYVCDLMDIFEKATRSKPTTTFDGRFHNFVEMCLTIIGPREDYQGPQALHEQIKKSFKLQQHR